MNKASTRNLILACLLLSAAVAVFGVMAYQVQAQGEKLNEQIETLRIQQTQEASHFQLRRQAEDTVEEREALQEYFLTQESESIDFLNDIETLAPQAGVELKTSALEAITDKNDESEWIQVTFTFLGERVSVQRFIKILENVPYVSRLTSVNMSRESSTLWKAEVTMRIRILAYDA